MCRWWTGCRDSWRARSGRPRRTKPRDWCSSGRWDAGPSDNLWSERRVGGGRGRAEPGRKSVKSVFGGVVVGQGPSLRLRSLVGQQSECLALWVAVPSSSRSPRVRVKAAPSPLRSIYHEHVPLRKVNYARTRFSLRRLSLSLCCLCPGARSPTVLLRATEMRKRQRQERVS